MSDHKEFHELLAMGVNMIVDFGKGSWGPNRVVELKDGTQYEYVYEENRYKKRVEKKKLNVAHL